jgi:outer membrane protein assembly factor BamA
MLHTSAMFIESIKKLLYSRTKYQVILLFLFSCLFNGCTNHISRDKLPFPLTSNSCAENVKVVTVPLPVIASSPNEGITSGALAAFLIHNRNDEVHTLLAPQVNYNSNFGVTSSLYSAFYPNSELNVETNLSQSTIVNYDYSFKLRDIAFLSNKLELNASGFAFADGSARFFGFHAKSPAQMETNYADQEIGYNISVGYQFAKDFQFVVGDRFRHVEIRKGAVKKLPNVKDKFSVADVPGLDGFSTHAIRFSLIYSTLNNRDTPTHGNYVRLSIEPTAKVLGGAANYRDYEAEIKSFIPFDNSRYITVIRFMYNQTLNDKSRDDVPFLEQSILGGENSLRGYGRNRFIDNTFILLNLEERIRLFRWEIFNVTADWEVAPFFDLGAVMSSMDKFSTNNFEYNPGIGFRAIVRPNIVGRVDIGVGKNGPAVFVGLGYPF